MSTEIVFDIGGTRMRAAAVLAHGGLGEVKTRATPQELSLAAKALAEIALEATGGERPSRACGGVPGTFEEDGVTLYRCPNLPGWEGKKPAEEFTHVLGAETIVKNDAALAALGEARRGAGRTARIVGYMTVSTGVGGARVSGGKLDDSAHGFEPGWEILDFKSGATLESLVSGSSFERRFGKKAMETPQNDSAWAEVARDLAHGLHEVIVNWSPDVMVLGGSMMLGTPCIPLETVKEELGKTLTAFPTVPQICIAELGDSSGLFGALEFLKSS